MAIEFKSAKKILANHLKGIRAFHEEHRARRLLVVSCDPGVRKTGEGIELMHWQTFCRQLWKGAIVQS
ncbi:MAG: hypothetical protein HYV02_08360 [Deltaproteobacteria bacterium]|nr:hypothetical protein [Deltaproteobacteria bacterium]